MQQEEAGTCLRAPDLFWGFGLWRYVHLDIGATGSVIGAGRDLFSDWGLWRYVQLEIGATGRDRCLSVWCYWSWLEWQSLTWLQSVGMLGFDHVPGRRYDCVLSHFWPFTLTGLLSPGNILVLLEYVYCNVKNLLAFSLRSLLLAFWSFFRKQQIIRSKVLK